MSEGDLPSKLTKILKSEGEVIKGIFFDLDDGEEVERLDDDDVYSLHIILMYSEVFSDAFQRAQRAAERITELIGNNFYDKVNKFWRKIELGSCEAVSDESMPVALAERLKRWNADYISLRDAQHALMND